MIIPAALSFVDLGFGTAAATRMVHAAAQGDQKTFVRSFSCGVWAVHLLLIAGALLGIVATHYIFAENTLSTGKIGADAAYSCVAMMMGARFVCFYQQIFEGIFIARHQAHVGMNLHAGYALANLILTAACLLSNGTAQELSALTLLWSVTYTLIYCTWAYRVAAVNGLWKARPDMVGTKALFRNGIGYMAAPAGQIMMFQGCTAVVNGLFGPVAVVIFNTGRTLTRTLTQIYSLVISSAMSELQFEIGSGRLTSARRLFRLMTLLSLIVGLTGSLALEIWGGSIYQAWVGKAVTMPTALMPLLLVGVAVSAFWLPAQHVFLAANRPFTFARWSTSAAIVSISVSYLLGAMFGLAGVAAACSLYDVVLGIALFPKACVFLHQSLRLLLSDMRGDIRAVLLRE